MDREGYQDKRNTAFESDYYSSNIPFLRGRPRREEIINGDDVNNFLIAVNTCESIDEFISIV